MNLLLDENLSPRLVEILERLGHDAVHVSAIGLRSATDAAVFGEAVSSGRTLISLDTDFGEILLRSEIAKPSLLIFRQSRKFDVEALANQIHRIVSVFETDISAGVLILVEDSRLRVRKH